MCANELIITDFTGKVLSEGDIKERVEELRKLVLGDNKLRKIRTDDGYLLRFLHCTDFNVALAFKRMQDFHNLILENPEWFIATSPLDKKTQIHKNAKAMLREKDKAGRRIFVCKLGKMDTQKSSPQEQAQIDELWFEYALDDPIIQAKGISIIMDMSGYPWKLFKWLTPGNLKVNTKTVDLFPCKEFVYHVVNTSFWANASIKMAWPFMSESNKERVKFHFEDWSSLHMHISADVLPPEYGGTGPGIDFDKLNEFLFDQDSEIRKKLEYRRIHK